MESPLSPWERFLWLLLGCALLVLSFNAGFTLAYCPLCCRDLPSGVPILLDLATNQTADLRVSSPNTSQKTGYFNHISLGTAQGYRDGGVRCRISFHDQNHSFNKFRYCRKCRKLLARTGSTGFVVLYHDEQDRLQICPIIPDTTHFLPDYILQCFWENSFVTLTVEPYP